MTRRLRIAAFVCALALTISPVLSASSVLLRTTSKASPEPLLVQTYAGKTEALVSSVQPSAPLTVVVLLDTLSPVQYASIEKDLLAMYAALRKHPLRIALLHNGSLGMAGPFASRARLKAALDDAAQAATDPPAALPLTIVDTLCAAASQLGADWSRTLLVGELPAMDPSTTEYAAALLSRAFGMQRIQASWYALSGGNDGWLPALQATGGGIVRGDLREYAASLDNPGQFWFQVDWASASPSAGFIVSRAMLADAQGQVLLESPDLTGSPNLTLPTLIDYSAMQAKLAGLAVFLTQPSAPVDDVRIRDDLRAALEINPRDPVALATAASFYEKWRDYSTAAVHRAALTEIRPQDGAALSALGHVLLLAGDFDKSEQALNRAITISATTPQVAEDFARIHLARKNDKAALPYLDTALRADAKRQDLWFLQGHAGERLGDAPLAIHSFEQGLALGGAHITEATSLLRLDLAAKQNGKALELARRTIAELPPDPGIRAEFAEALDTLQQPRESLSAWKRVLEVKNDDPRAHYRIARLTFESGDSRAAEEAANAGLAVAPKYASLYLVKADALAKQHRMYDARQALAQGVEAAPDPQLLARWAELEDTYGAPAASAYARLAEASAGSAAERQLALERGFTVALREQDSKQAKSFAALLQVAGNSQARALLGAGQRSDDGALVPGGLEALAFASRVAERVKPERFFAEYCRAIADRNTEAPKEFKLYLETIREHFQRIEGLQAFGKREGDRVVITLSANTKDARRNTERVLDLLGIKLKSSKGEVAVDRGEKKGQARKQDTVSALALDEVGMQDAFQAGKPFSFEIVSERAPLYPSEKLWRDAFYAKENESAGFATAVLRLPKMATLYLALNSLDRKSIAALLAAVPLQTLYEHYTEQLQHFAAAFALEGTHAAVPGGRSAETIWAELVGAPPSTPGAFFSALLERDNGKVLAYFFTLSQLDRAHQAFFTANPQRAERFFKLFASTQEMQRRSATGYSAFSEFLRAVPLDRENHVEFPGSPEIWAVAKGRSTDEAQSKLFKRVSRSAAPDIEDEVLLRLAQTHYNEKIERHTELDNFLAVARIDAHRLTPLDEESAFLLAQRYSDSYPGYPYFTDLRALEAADYRQFFAAVDRMRSQSHVDANLHLGQLHSLVEWICLFSRLHVIDDNQAAKLFRFVSSRFAAADSGAAYTMAALDSARTILEQCKVAGPPASADEKLKSCLLGVPNGSSNRRAADFQAVLEAQKVPSLDALFSLYAAAAKLSHGGVGDVASIEKGTANFALVALPKGAKAEGKEKESILRYEPVQIQKLVAELREKAGRRKANPRDIENIARDLIAALEPQVTLALAGPVYAYFLRSKDLMVSEDPLLLRKHRYMDFGPQASHAELLSQSRFNQQSEGAGSYFLGGFAQFGLAAGTAAAVGWKSGGYGGNEAIAAEIAAIRGAVWNRLDESDQRLLVLRIEAAREWIVESARRPAEFRALSEETMGLLSLSRRSELLSGIESRDWNQVWSSVTLPDLAALGAKYLERFKTDSRPSPVFSALREVSAGNDGSRLATLGAVTFYSFGCSHPHFQPNAPYEEYERHFFPDAIAERFAEFKLFLVLQADALGVQPAVLGEVAETLAAKAFRSAKMADFRDWRSLQAAYASISTDDVKQALEQ
jgi:Flp pilus assembly protein TadD